MENVHPSLLLSLYCITFTLRGSRSTANCQMVNGQHSTVKVQLLMGNRLRSIINCQWSPVYRQWSTVYGQWSTVYGQWATDYGH